MQANDELNEAASVIEEVNNDDINTKQVIVLVPDLTNGDVEQHEHLQNAVFLDEPAEKRAKSDNGKIK